MGAWPCLGPTMVLQRNPRTHALSFLRSTTQLASPDLDQPRQTIYLSTVTPVYQGADYLVRLVQALAHVKQGLHDRNVPVDLAEAIFADDGSRDNSAAVLADLARQYPWVKVVTMSRNFGQHAATIAGVLHTSGDWVATLDEDLQHPPNRLEELLTQAILRDQDIMFARGASAVHRSWFRDGSSRLYKWLLSRLSGNAHVSRFSSFRMVRGSIARAAASVASHETYLDMALCWFSNRIDSLTMPLMDERYATQRKSGYNLWSLIRHARRMFISSQVKLLRFGALVGILALLAGVLLLPVIVAVRPWSVVRGWGSTMAAILFFGGVSCFLLGVILEYMSVLLLRAQGKPTYFAIDRSKDEILRAWLQEQPRP